MRRAISESNTCETRTTLSRAHTFAKAADSTKLLLLNKHQPGKGYTVSRGIARTSPKRNYNPTLTLTLA